MARNKHPSFKQKLQKFGTQHNWAPFWTVLKIYGKGVRRLKACLMNAQHAHGGEECHSNGSGERRAGMSD